MRILYRVRQFWHALLLKIDPAELEQAQKILSPAQWTLFTQLQRAELAHSLVMYRKLLAQGDCQPDLLQAALLHDIGKLCYPMNPLQRAMVVIMRTLVPDKARAWGCVPPEGWKQLPGWRKPFILKENHAEWGAQMARNAGTSPLTEQLIRQHHQRPSSMDETVEKHLQHQLWLVDNQS